MTAPGPGHNGGPSLEGGRTWRAHCWRAARAALLPKLPVEVVRLRVKRAAEIGLDYRTYAGIRAATGHDLVAFLFSTNALRVLRDRDRMQAEDAAKLAGLKDIENLVAVQPPLDPARIVARLAGQGVRVAAADRAPTLAQNWHETRARLHALAATVRAPADCILIIGETAQEEDWAATARMAGFLAASRYFGARVTVLAR